MLREREAEPIGIEPTPALLERARQLDPQGVYHQAGAEHLPFGDAEFDLCVLYLVLIDVEDYRSAIREAARVLRPGGRLLVVNITPMRSANRIGWIRDAQGRRQTWQVEDYGREWAHVYEWAGMRVRNHHRPMSAYMRAFLGEGLRLELYEEPLPDPNDESRADEWICPNFDVWLWRKEV